jgi:uncharacterized protein
MRRKLAFALAALILLALDLRAPLRAAELQPLSVVTKNRKFDFMVEVALTKVDQARGLMFRRELPPSGGMLFVFVPTQPVAFWMKNTYVPLDIIFIDAGSRIRRIAADAKPLSEHRIPSGGPVRAVLEVAAGTAARLGIRPGDQVEHPILRRR